MRLPASLALTLAFTLSPLAQAAGSDPVLAQADQLLAQRQPQAAFDLLAPLEDERAGDPDYDYLLGLAALESGHGGMAAFAFERCLATDPKNGPCRVQMARTHLALGENGSAREELEAVQASNPPAEVSGMVSQYLGTVTRREAAQKNKLDFHAQLGAGYDTNVSSTTASHFSLNSSMLSVTDSSGACGSSAGSCYANIDAFFAGDASTQVGASYSVDDYMNFRFMSGVAALGLSSYNSNTVLDSGPGYTLAYAGPTGYAVPGGYTAFDASTYTTLDTALTNTFDAGGNLITSTAKDANGNTVTLMDSGTATGTEVGQTGGLKWGRWYNSGTAAVPVVTNGTPGTLGAGESLHYVTGAMTQPDFFNAAAAAYTNGSTATYTYQGGTTASATDGSTGRVVAGSSLSVIFWSTTQLTLDMNVAMNNGDNYHLGGSTLASLSNNGATFSFIAGSGGTCSGGAAAGSTSGCSANVQGFFAGQQAQQIGLSYQINDFSGRKVTGAAAFGRGALTANTSLP